MNEFIANEAYLIGGCPFVPKSKIYIEKGQVNLLIEFIDGILWKDYQLKVILKNNWLLIFSTPIKLK